VRAPTPYPKELRAMAKHARSFQQQHTRRASREVCDWQNLSIASFYDFFMLLPTYVMPFYYRSGEVSSLQSIFEVCDSPVNLLVSQFHIILLPVVYVCCCCVLKTDEHNVTPLKLRPLTVLDLVWTILAAGTDCALTLALTWTEFVIAQPSW
jgi:hypothetical protein